MRVGADLRTKALLALEEVTHDCRFRVPERTFLVRFTLAWLFSISRTRDPEPFLEFWRAIAGDNELFRFSKADLALSKIYLDVGAKRDDEASRAMWLVAQHQHEKRTGRR
jgi:hypothetical protein